MLDQFISLLDMQVFGFDSINSLCYFHLQKKRNIENVFQAHVFSVL